MPRKSRNPSVSVPSDLEDEVEEYRSRSRSRSSSRSSSSDSSRSRSRSRSSSLGLEPEDEERITRSWTKPRSSVGKFLENIVDRRSEPKPRRHKPAPAKSSSPSPPFDLPAKKKLKDKDAKRKKAAAAAITTPPIAKLQADKSKKTAGKQRITALKEARKRQQTSQFMFRWKPFQHLVDRIADLHRGDLKFQKDARTDIQRYTEKYIRLMCVNAYLAACHAGRESISASDLWLTNNICTNLCGGDFLKRGDDEGRIEGITADDLRYLGETNLHRIAVADTTCSRVSSDFYDMARKIVSRFIDRVVRAALESADAARRKTISAVDIKDGVKKQGYFLY